MNKFICIEELDRHGIEVKNNLFECQTCGSVWDPLKAPGIMKPNWLRCPNGCNTGKCRNC